MLEIALAWALFGVGAAFYVRALRRAQALSPPMPLLSPGGTRTFRATVRIGSWASGNAYSDQVLVDDRHLVLVMGRRHRAVLRRDEVHALHDAGIFGWLVVHDGEKREFGVRRKDAAALRQHLERGGWPVRDGWPPGRSQAL